MVKCINLYIQTEYSFLSSLLTIDKLKDALMNYEYDACAITDDNMCGVIKFYNMCKSSNIKPLIGYRLMINVDGMESSILLYAMNNIGYCNLMQICTLKSLNQNITLNDLESLSYGILAIIPSQENEIIKHFLNNDINKAISVLNKYKHMFNNLYLGIDLQTPISKEISEELIKFGRNQNIEMVAINKTSYFAENDIEAYKILRSVNSNNKNYELTALEKNLSLLSIDEMNLLFNKYPFLLENTMIIKDKLNVTITFNEFKFPKYDIINSEEYLEELCKIGLNKRLSQEKERVDIDAYKKRLLYELDIIKRMGFVDYFLIVFDYVKYAKTHDICVGPGRGSAGGSLVSYSLGITNIDPIKYDLLFERFLNPERVSMPDIDVDFPDNRRDEVIRYIGKRFGEKRVAHINTFGTYKARLAIRDVARMINISDNKLKEVLKYIPQFSNALLKDIISSSSQLMRMMETDEEINYLLFNSMKIEGLPRNCSTHAAGIIMADTVLTNYTPLQPGIDGLLQTQYEASDLEALGLVKMDVLGIRNLSIIKTVLDDVKLREGIDININNIPMNDQKVMNMLARGETLGIFQLESDGVSKLLMNLKCSTFDDIVNATSLYRPGPMEMIPLFIKRKFGEPYELIHPDLKDILKKTYGIIVFQEQIMLIAQKFAGYTLGQADILRRAVSKKKASVLKEERIKFIEGSIKKGYSQEKANEIYDYIEKFADYGFNKSHAVAYALIAYQMAYLKAYHFKSFMTALMTNNIGSVNSLIKYINECKKEHIIVYGPNINISDKAFVYNDEGIYYSLLGINNLGDVVVTNIINERCKRPFSSFEDFVFRTKDIINKRQFSSLVFSGALDVFQISKKGMIDNYDLTLQRMEYKESLGDKIINNEIKDDEYPFYEISENEFEALGFNLKYNEFIKYNQVREKYKCETLINCSEEKNYNTLAIVRYIREIKTKKNDKMAFITMFDETGEMEGVIFPNTYTKVKSVLNINKAFIFTFKVEKRNQKSQAIIDSIYNFE